MPGNVTPVRTLTVGEEANRFDLQGYGTKISFSMNNISRQPSLSYEDQHRDLHFGGADIAVEETGIGKLVTVEIEAEPDAHRLTISFLLPRLNLPDGDECSFQTEAILTNHLTTTGGPDRVKGQRMTYSSLTLSGRARRAKF